MTKRASELTNLNNHRMANILIDTEVHKRNQFRNNIEFLIQHLDNEDLKIVQELMKGLAKRNSESYKKWWEKANFGVYSFWNTIT